MVSKTIFKQVLTWAAIGAVLSLFLAHPPLNHHDPVDRLADRVIGALVWGILGGIAALVFALFRRPAAISEEHLPAQPVQLPRSGTKHFDDLQAQVASQGKTGICVSIEDGRTIIGVSNGSSAQTAGISVGDQIIAIDNKLCDTDYKSNVLRLVGSAGTSVRISVWRGDAAHTYDVVRA